ncbi:MAG: LacI family transcriptional regulator [Clostridiales bacterium]|nr:LacI family transcriptional regulator [Clostridiales bacterium]
MTLKEIAELAGVSTATVSYVLNGSARVSEETKQKIEKIVQETGYRSNLLAKSLRKSRTSLVGVLVEDVTVWHVAHIIDGINALAEEKGYHTILSNLRLLSKIGSRFEDITKYQGDIDRAVDVLTRMQVDGILYVGMHDREIDEVLHDIDKPIVYCYSYTLNEGSSVRYSNEKAAYQITERFLEKGHREFAVVRGLDSEPATLRMRGITRALKEADIMLSEENIICGDWEYDVTLEAARKVLERPDHPKAFIAMNDMMAVAVRNAARELGLRVPEDISVSGFDNADIVRYVQPKITTVAQPLHDMGYRAMEILLDKIENGDDGDVSITLPCKIIEGASIARV